MGTVGLSLVNRFLSEALVLAGRVDEALSLARDALARSRDHKERGYEAWALRLLGEIASYPQSLDTETSEGHDREAAALATELGMRPLAAHCHLGLGKLKQRSRKRRQAQDHLIAATMMFRQMDMRFWLQKAETETRALG